MDAELHFLIPGIIIFNHARLKLKLNSIYFLNKRWVFLFILKLILYWRSNTHYISELEIKNKVRHCHSSVSIYKMYKKKFVKRTIVNLEMRKMKWKDQKYQSIFSMFQISACAHHFHIHKKKKTGTDCNK